MFPYTPPKHPDEVWKFMANLGATRRDTRYSVVEKEQPVESTFFVTAFPDRPVATWDYSDIARQYKKPESWATVLERDLTGSLIEDSYMIRDHRMFDFCDRVARTLTAAGYQQGITAATLVLYRHRYHHRQPATAGHPLDNLFRCADIRLLYRLTPEQQLDCACRDLPVTDLVDLLDEGAPYTLIKDMFPMPV